LSNACGGQAVFAEATPHEIRNDGLRCRLCLIFSTQTLK
jgi:hypothetical protein